MQAIYLQNDQEYVKVLKYLPNNGEFQEILRSNLPEGITLWRGEYLNIDGLFYGIYASNIGPIFFHQKERFPLRDQNCEIEFIDGTQEKCFTLYWGGIKKVVLKYLTIKFKDYDNWSSNEEFVDMFLRISRDVLRKNFWQFFTVK